jgi:hypothetical protein
MSEKLREIQKRIEAARNRQIEPVEVEQIAPRMAGDDKSKIADLEGIIAILRKRLRDAGLSDNFRR